MKPAEVVDVPGLGVQVKLCAADDDAVTFEVSGRSRGFLRQAHVHVHQHETIEVLSGSLRVNDRVLEAGESIEIPPGTAHTQNPAGPGEGAVRITHRPAGRTVEFLQALVDLDVNHFGFPKPRAGARFLRSFWHDSRPALPSPQYTFVDEWDVAAPIEDVWDVLADGLTYPEWWQRVYLSAETDGKYTLQHFKGRLPYHLHTRTRTIRHERPYIIEGETDGDLRGHGLWTLSETAAGTHIRFDWQVHADRRLLRLLTPVLRPALRWNHNWAIARAREGLGPYVLARSPVAA